jgi:hypothetical protein
MIKAKRLGKWTSVLAVWALLGTVAAQSQTVMYRLGPLPESSDPLETDVIMQLGRGEILFQVEDPRAAAVQVQVSDAAGEVLYDSGVQGGREIRWSSPAEPDFLKYRLSAWDWSGASLGSKIGEVNLSTSPEMQDLAMDVSGDWTIGGYLGVGTDSPQRAVHLKGSNAVFRLDRSMDTASFLLVRTDTLANPLKTFVVGVNASGANQGEFIINDIGAAVGGGGQRRMTITNSGDTIFGGSVTATQYYVPSSERFKSNIQVLEDPVAKLEQLRGVSFEWKESGLASLGVIAEEVAKVVPEAVSWDEEGKEVVGVNYDSLLALLIEAAKVQQQELDKLTSELDELSRQVEVELKRRDDSPDE